MANPVNESSELIQRKHPENSSNKLTQRIHPANSSSELAQQTHPTHLFSELIRPTKGLRANGLLQFVRFAEQIFTSQNMNHNADG